MITIFNTLTGKKEQFASQNPQAVSMYVCGITPYDYAHIGHGRVYVTFDVLFRLLTFLGYKVSYCRNFTDIDDKIIARAQKELNDEHKFLEIPKKYIAAYTQDMDRLNCLQPNYQPCVTDHMSEIIDFIQGLVDAGKAYVADGDVYFSIKQFAEYGKLSKRNLDDLQVGARVEVNPKKKNPLDFVLWKGESEGGVAWDSPWGKGRPGWHIECSALAKRYFGNTIDIHAGGLDLIFPHHENEIAQSEGLHKKQFANYWMHNGFVQVNKEKMSKSLDNFFTLRDVFTQFDPMVVRFYLLSHHYKAPLDFSFDDIVACQKSYQKLCRVFDDANCDVNQNPSQIMQSEIVNKMLNFLGDDLNTPGMWGVVFENISIINQDATQRCQIKAFIHQVIGLPVAPLPEKEQVMTPEIQQLLQEREQARAAKDWEKSDTIRDKLVQLGWNIQDKKI